MKEKERNVKEMKEQLKKELDGKRYEHTIGVAYTAAALAMAYHSDVNQAFLAGLLHDCAKCMKKQDRELFCKKHHIQLTEEEIQIPALQHAKIGSVYCETKYHISDPEIKTAILYHTTGKPDMTMLEKIICIADYIEPNRVYPGVETLRQIAYRNLNAGLLASLDQTILHLMHEGTLLHPYSIATRNRIMAEQINRNKQS